MLRNFCVLGICWYYGIMDLLYYWKSVVCMFGVYNLVYDCLLSLLISSTHCVRDSLPRSGRAKRARNTLSLLSCIPWTLHMHCMNSPVLSSPRSGERRNERAAREGVGNRRFLTISRWGEVNTCNEPNLHEHSRGGREVNAKRVKATACTPLNSSRRDIAYYTKRYVRTCMLQNICD